MSTLIYLDSSDFSDLSSSTITDADRELISDLRDQIKQKAVRCVFSLIHLSEATHSNLHYKPAATRRGRLIAELCERNSLLYPSELFSLEIKKATSGEADGRLPIAAIFSPRDRWFGLSLNPNTREWRNQVNSCLKDRAASLPRRERRKFLSEMSFSRKSGRERWRACLKNSPASSITEFPMNLIEQDFIDGWILGDRTDQELLERLHQVLDNPAAMIESVLDETNERSTIYQTLREQGTGFHDSVNAKLARLFGKIDSVPFPTDDATLAKIFRDALPKELLFRSVVEAYAAFDTSKISDEETIALVERCPSLGVFARVYVAYYHSLFGAALGQRKAGKSIACVGKPSDFGDLMHASYAPYVDVFRCDGHFGELLKQDKIVRGKIVSKRSALSTVLDRCVADAKKVS